MNSKKIVLSIAYDEIGLKGKNRSSFEHQLIGNIKSKFPDLFSDVLRETGFLVFHFKKELGSGEQERLIQSLRLEPGISHFRFPLNLEKDFDEIKEASLEEVGKSGEFATFAVNAQRSDKTFEIASIDINKDVGALIWKKYQKPVNIKNPELEVYIQIGHHAAYLSTKRYEGAGGLPINPRQKVICLLSGGIDSPVAAFMMMKRGCHVTFIHFMNENQSSSCVKSKIKDLAEKLREIQGKTQLVIFPFEKLQKAIIKDVEAKYRMLVYRHYMIQIAGELAKKVKAYFLITGDNMSQVASQTLDNLQTLYERSSVPILAPLIGLNKREIIQTARVIGTYNISKLPYDDCCSYFVPKHPALSVPKRLIDELMKMDSIQEIIQSSLKEVIRMEL